MRIAQTSPMLAQHHLKLPAFVAECTLGKLAKWLRLAGFDTLYDLKPPDFRRLVGYVQSENRLVLSRTRRVIKHLEETQGVLIECNAPIDQARQVMRHFNIQREDLRPLSRCSQCNLELLAVDRENFPGAAVPDYVRQYYERFRICAQCRRIYWPGSHSRRISALIDRWFGI